MALNNTGDLLADPVCTQQVCSPLCMKDRVTRPSPDIVEHRPLSYLIHRNKGIALRVFQCNIAYGSAVSYNLFAAPCFTQLLLIVFF
jgi:hypothetical protein